MRRDECAAATLREKAETLAGLMSVGSLGPDESEIGVNVIFDLLAENQRFAEEIERRAAENARLQDGVIQMVNALWSIYEQAQSVARKPRSSRMTSAATASLREWMKQARGDGFVYCCETAEENGLTYEVLDGLLTENDRLRDALDEIDAQTSGAFTGEPQTLNRLVAIRAAIDTAKGVG